MKNTEKTMEKIVALCKGRGFVFAGSEIYGGLANTWDYGPLGVELKNNVKKAWWKKFVQENHYNVGLDAAILMNPQVWVASGHVGGFSDPLMDCKECKERFRADKVIEDWCAEHDFTLPKPVDALSQAEMKAFVDEHQIPCPSCGKHNWTDIRQFNLMFKTFQGVTEDAKNTVYLRPETAQGIFVNFKNVQRTSRKKVPFGIAQIGKSFRNEITPGNFTFRTREFEQMELEFFCKPDTDLEWFAYWKEFCINWLKTLGIKDDEMRARDHSPEELCFYSKATTDLEFLFPFGWGELWGIADRTDYDLTQHQNTSGQDMTYFDDEKNQEIVDHLLSELTFEQEEESTEEAIFEGMTFVITGSVEHFANRKELQEAIEVRGGKATGSVTSKTTYLINNDVASNSSKNKKAKDLGVPIISEEEFIKMLGE